MSPPLISDDAVHQAERIGAMDQANVARMDLSCNLLRAGGTAVLAQELRGRGLGQVRHLDLSRNQRRASGCSELAHVCVCVSV